jgi:hypothetical protein
MARKNRKTIPSISTPDEDYQVRDDADKIRRYAELRSNKNRHSKAMSRIKTEHSAIIGLDDGDETTEQPRMLARAGRKVMARNISRA